jgi:replicative DNA helicase
MSVSERAALAIFLEEPALVDGCGLTSNHFLSKQHRIIFDEIVAQSGDKNADMTTIASSLQGSVDFVYIGDLYGEYYQNTSKTLDKHVKKIVHDYNAQKVKYISGKMMTAEGDPLTILTEAAEELEKCTSTKGLYRTNKDILKGTMATLEKRLNSPDGVVGERMHFKKLDALLGGGHDGRLWVMGGRPGQGKSALAGNIVERKAIKNNEPCCIFSLEMGDETWMERFLMSVAKVSPSEKENFYGFKESDYSNMMAATEKIVNAPLYIIEYGGMTIDDICTTVKLMKKKHGVNFFIIDYLQQIAGSGDEYETVTRASKRLATLKQTLKVNILALAQLNRQSEAGGKARKPTPSDLRNSGQIEQDADGIFFVHRPSYYDKSCTDSDVISVPKNRHGATGDIQAKFTGRNFKWEEV